MTTLKRWVCPRCGKGKLAPSRPRADDVRPWCLTCSAKTGRFVKRVAPALEAKRAAKKESRADRAKRERVKERERAVEEGLQFSCPVLSGEKFIDEIEVSYAHDHQGIVHPPHYAQASMTFVTALVWFASMPDHGREAVIAGLRNAAPSWFPERIINTILAWPHTGTHATGAYAWSYLAAQLNKRGATFAEQVRTHMLESLREYKADPRLATLADEIESTPLT